VARVRDLRGNWVRDRERETCERGKAEKGSEYFYLIALSPDSFRLSTDVSQLCWARNITWPIGPFQNAARLVHMSVPDKQFIPL
jgi:hypothetical protein